MSLLRILFTIFVMFNAFGSAIAEPPMKDWARQAQKRVVKIYGAGGLQSLEAYQSGFLVSPEGHIATAWSYVLDVEPIVLLDDGRRYESKIEGFEPSLGLAVLKLSLIHI